MNYAKIIEMDIANGEGIRTTVFLSGCNVHCKNCFNRDYWKFEFGNNWTKEVEDAFIKAGQKEVIAGYSILGGEPLQQDLSTMLSLIKCLKEKGKKSIWLWSGYSYEELSSEQLEIVHLCDVFIDGLFIEEKKNLSLHFRGSDNQRLIDIPKTLKKGDIVLWETPYLY